MKPDLHAEPDLLNRNVDELIRLCQCATDVGVWTTQEAGLHTAHLDLLRTKVNADFRELIALRERLREARERALVESRPLLPKL